MPGLSDFMNHRRGECLLEPTFKKSVGKDKLDFSHMIDNRAFGGFFFRGINSMSIAG
jgi:hypothetical protein